MEKKSIVKNNADCRRTDTYPVKPQRNKKREFQTNASPRNQNNRKHNAWRGKSLAKCHQHPDGFSGSHMGGKEIAGLDDGIAEVGSIFLPGSKKQNLNHLLNFHYSSRETGFKPSKGNRKHHGLIYTDTHKHNKELFLQSNCQFVVKSDGDYSPYMADPDIPICWDFVEQINVRISEPLSCPICLGETVAGRITKCGHVYCWPCLLRYFSFEDISSRPCPVCSQPIDKIHLKSVQGIWHNYTPVGEKITMTLMRRLRGSSFVELAPPLDVVNKETENITYCPYSMSDRNPSSVYSKILTATPKEVIVIIARERQELNSQLTPDVEHPEFILEALHLLKLREDSLPPGIYEVPKYKSENNETNNINNDNNTNVNEIDSVIDDSLNLFAFDPCTMVNSNDSNESSNFSIIESEEDANKSDISEIELKGEIENTTPTHNNADSPLKPKTIDKYIYFYQADDGQAIFLYGLYNRILEASWGSLSLAPRELRGTIKERVSGSVDAEARRRLRCLQHLPIHCPYDFIDIDLKPPFVTLSALKEFKVELDDRRRKRYKRAHEEKRIEKTASEKEQIIMGRIPAMEININSEEHFPAYHHKQDVVTSPELKCEKEMMDLSPGPSSLGRNDTSMSFAKMAATEGIWKIRQTPKSQMSSSKISDDKSDDEVGSPLECNLGDVISVALQKTSLESNLETTHREGKKKKKQKPKVLFATGIHHA